MIKKTIFCRMVLSTLAVALVASCSLKKPDLNEEQAKTFHHMGNFTSKHADYARAADLYKKAYKLDPSKSKSLLSLAKVQVLMGKNDAAISTYHKVLQQDKNNKEAKQGLAVAYFTDGDSLEAVEQWNSVLAQEPANIEALNGLGLVMEQIHHYKEAQACFKHALKSAPDNAVVLNNLGLSLAMQGSVSEGIKQLRAAQKIKSSVRLKNNIHLLKSIANKEQTPEALSNKLDTAFPPQKNAFNDKNKLSLVKSVQKWC